MFTSGKNKPLESTPFSEFVRNAPAKMKKRVFTDVLKKASEDQQAIIAKAASKA